MEEFSDLDPRLKAFCAEAGVAPETVDLPSCTAAFSAQMEAGLNGEASPLLMLPTWLSGELDIPAGGQAIALDAGGTNLRTALVRFGPDGPRILWQKTQPMPGTQGSITKKEFLRTLAQSMEPVLDRADRIGFCFSFPAEVRPDLDAVVLNFNKEVQISGAAGMHLAKELQACLSKPMKIAVLNDTAATLLGGIGLGGDYDGLIGFILGTGTNTCYPESGERLSRYEGFSGQSMLINTESAGFDGFPRGQVDRELDLASALPGDHLYEKAVSGGYLGRLIGLTLARAARAGLVSAALGALPEPDMAAVDAFLRAPQGENILAQACSTSEDRRVAEALCRACIRRAARLAAANLTAVMLQAGSGRRAPARIVAEGSTFWRCDTYRQAICRELEVYASGQLGLQWEIVRVEHANLVGAAAAAFCSN